MKIMSGFQQERERERERERRKINTKALGYGREI